MIRYIYQTQICRFLAIVNLSHEQFNNVIDFKSIKVAFFMRSFGQILKHRNYSTEHKQYISSGDYL